MMHLLVGQQNASYRRRYVSGLHQAAVDALRNISKVYITIVYLLSFDVGFSDYSVYSYLSRESTRMTFDISRNMPGLMFIDHIKSIRL